MNHLRDTMIKPELKSWKSKGLTREHVWASRPLFVIPTSHILIDAIAETKGQDLQYLREQYLRADVTVLQKMFLK